MKYSAQNNSLRVEFLDEKAFARPRKLFCGRPRGRAGVHSYLLKFTPHVKLVETNFAIRILQLILQFKLNL